MARAAGVVTDSFILAELLEATHDNVATPSRAARVGAFHVRLLGDRIFDVTTLLLALVVLSVLVGLAIALMVDSFAVNPAFGWGFLVSTDWDPVNDRLRRAAVHLWHGGLLGLGADDRGAAEPRRGALPERDGAGVAQPPAGLPGRAAGGDSRAWSTDCGRSSCSVRGCAITSSRCSAHAWLSAAVPGAARLGEHAVARE